MRLIIILVVLCVVIAVSGSVVVTEGDSITRGDSSTKTGYGYIGYALSSWKPTTFTNIAVSGSGLANLVLRASTNVDVRIEPGASNVMSVLIGANDLDGQPLSWVTNYWTDLKDYYAARKSAGWSVVACTVTPRTNATFTAQRAALNALIRSEPAAYDALCDFATNEVVGLDTNAWDVAMYPDGLHPSVACQTNLALIWQPVVWRLLTNAPAAAQNAFGTVNAGTLIINP